MSDRGHRMPSLSLVIDARGRTSGPFSSRLARAGIAARRVLLLLGADDLGAADPLGEEDRAAAPAGYDGVVRLPPRTDLVEFLGRAVPGTDWVLVLRADEVLGHALLADLEGLLRTEDVDRWLLNCRTVHPDGERWLTGETWSRAAEPRLWRTRVSRNPVERTADHVVCRLGLVLTSWVDRWRRALREDVLRTADRDREWGGFPYWLPERTAEPATEPLARPDREHVSRLVAQVLRAPAPSGDPAAVPARRRDPRDELRALTMPGLPASRRRQETTVEDRLGRRPQPHVIPRILHQVWLGGRPVPEDFRRYAGTWRNHHPGWVYRLWTEHNLPPLRSAPVLHRARYFAEQADVVRLELLTLFGGVYVDMDFECLSPLDPLLDGVAAFAGLERPGWVGNAILGAAKGHPAYRFAWEQARDLVGLGKNPVEATGPFMLSRVLAEFPSVRLFEPAVLYPVAWNDRSPRPEVGESAVAVHHWALSHLEPRGTDDVLAVAGRLRDSRTDPRPGS
ncbi:glycosyltransferase [Streptomyces sp. NPDC056161]|uniref:glycosyltransferase n=1 Tax=Streptomyces sp. NPDC056161 TaxID=3345732 RepID=UPI0035DF8F05